MSARFVSHVFGEKQKEKQKEWIGDSESPCVSRQNYLCGTGVHLCTWLTGLWLGLKESWPDSFFVSGLNEKAVHCKETIKQLLIIFCIDWLVLMKWPESRNVGIVALEVTVTVFLLTFWWREWHPNSLCHCPVPNMHCAFAPQTRVIQRSLSTFKWAQTRFWSVCSSNRAFYEVRLVSQLWALSSRLIEHRRVMIFFSFSLSDLNLVWKLGSLCRKTDANQWISCVVRISE